MDYQVGFNILVAVVGALGGWMLNSLKESMKSLNQADSILAEKVQNIEVLVVGTYVKRDELDKFHVAVMTKLDRIESKLDGKVDK